jgi:hypothetical protein
MSLHLLGPDRWHTDTAFTDDQACASGGGGGKENGFQNEVGLDKKW